MDLDPHFVIIVIVVVLIVIVIRAQTLHEVEDTDLRGHFPRLDVADCHAAGAPRQGPKFGMRRLDVVVGH